MSPEATLVCLFLALIAFVLAAAQVGRWNINWLAVGAALWVLVPLWNAAEKAF